MSSHSDNPTVRGASLSGELVAALAAEAGFAAAALTALPHAAGEQEADRFAAWLGRGHAAGMEFLAECDGEGRLLRARLESAYPWARSAIVCFCPFPAHACRSGDPAAEDAAWIARYAWSSKPATFSQRFQADYGMLPSDYHRVLERRLERLAQALRAHLGGFQAQACVDSRPVNERALAVAAGLGWTGKNCALIHPRLGSMGYLAVLLCSLEAEAAEPMASRCGLCRRCLEACPTGALVAPGRLDARRCISYLTIEHRGPIPEELMERMGRNVFGCDICLEVCPWNGCAEQAGDRDFVAREKLVNPSLEWLGSLSEAEFLQLANGSPLRRANYWGLLRNVAIAMGHAGLGRFRPRLAAWTEAADEGLREAARWALRRLERGP